jgi:PPOX class probable F420-dependent enzyme
MLTLPDVVRSRLAGKNFWVLATVNADGSPTATPLWVDVDDEHILVNTAVGRLKERNVRRDPRVALTLVDADNPYFWIEIRGSVVERVEGPAADLSFYRMAEKYLGRATAVPDAPRVLLRVFPSRVAFRDELDREITYLDVR